MDIRCTCHIRIFPFWVWSVDQIVYMGRSQQSWRAENCLYFLILLSSIELNLIHTTTHFTFPPSPPLAITLIYELIVLRLITLVMKMAEWLRCTLTPLLAFIKCPRLSLRDSSRLWANTLEKSLFWRNIYQNHLFSHDIFRRKSIYIFPCAEMLKICYSPAGEVLQNHL